MKIAIAGASGFVGRHLVAALKKRGDEVLEITHEGDRLILGEQHRAVDAVINLSGSPVFGRWTDKKKAHILASRVQTAKDLNRFYAQQKIRPKVLITASAIGYYGDRPHETLIEESKKGKGFLADVVEAWEKASLDSPIHRVVIFRFGIILGKDGGALKKLKTQVRFHLGAQLGSGQQMISWIHIEDVVRAILYSLDRSMMKGVYNLVTEEAVTQERLLNSLCQAMHKKCFLKIPAFMLRGLLGESASLFLSDQKAYPKKLKQNDFEFLYPDVESAIYSLVRTSL